MNRFLIDSDYLSILTEEALEQLTRGLESRLEQAEEAAEQSIVEYLTENYEIEGELAVGKMLMPYSPAVTYPAGAHFKWEGQIVKATRPISGYKAPARSPYWIELLQYVPDEESLPYYTQRGSYSPGQRVRFNGRVYECLEYNGLEFDDVRVPDVEAWALVEDVRPWEANVEHGLWDVVSYDGHFYTLVAVPETPEEDSDDRGPEGWALNPYDSECWGMIDDWHRECKEYRHAPNEYVVYGGQVYYPVMNPVADEVKLGYNVTPHDPRNANIRKHMLRLAVYELFRLITPTNMSQTRITDYETSMAWLRDAGRLKITPGIPRKLDRGGRPVTDFATSTYSRSFDPYRMRWLV